jgi:hypothetical protein
MSSVRSTGVIAVLGEAVMVGSELVALLRALIDEFSRPQKALCRQFFAT